MALTIVYKFAQGQAAGSSNRMERYSCQFQTRVSTNAVLLCTRGTKGHFLSGAPCGVGSNRREKSGVGNLDLLPLALPRPTETSLQSSHINMPI